jgi:uncharacterized membrane-anchored protein YitT (DUF2179 family)
MKTLINKLWKYRDNRKLFNIIITLFGSVLYTIGVKWFIIPANQKTGGFTGIAQIIYGVIEPLLNDVITYDTGVSFIWFLLNIPVFYLGFKSLGRRFSFLSFIAVVFGMLSLSFLPIPDIVIRENIARDQMLSALLGGAIAGAGVGITLKVGASTGGTDIISQYLSTRYDRPFGYFSFMLNLFIIIVVGFTDAWIYALYTIINLFVMTIVIDKIHTRHNKLTLMIITDDKDEMIEAIHKRIYRGITVIPSVGAYSRKEKAMLMMVVSSYELYNVIATIKEIDVNAFTNVIKSQTVIGNFFKPKV